MKRSISLFLYIFCISALSVYSQDFKWECKTGKVTSDGFTEIVLSPKITGNLKTDFGDIRIYDSTGTEIPYIQHSETPVLFKQLFKEYKVLQKVHYYDYTRLVIHNPDKTVITNFSLIIKNADVRKWLTLSASDDQKEWYALKEHYYFQSFYNEDSTSEIRVLDFPKSNYEYYELLVYDYFDYPINILKVGYYDTSVETGKYSEVDTPAFTQKDSLKQSIIQIHYPSQQYIDKLQFEIGGPEFYYREAQICIKKETVIKKGDIKTNYETIKTFKISSNSDNTVLFSNFPAQDLYLIIENNDDQPLKIKSVKGFQLNHYLTANLKAENFYWLRFGNEKLDPPVYDLKFFTDSIPDNLPQVKCGTPVNIEKVKLPEDKPFYFDPVFLWIVIGVIALLLGYITLKMVKEMPRKG